VKQPLAIVGASTRSAAASAVRAGFQPLAADLFGDVDLQRIATTTRIRPYPEGFLDWMRAVEPPGWMYTGALENYPELVDQMAWIAPLLGNPGDVLARVRSPWELCDSLRGAGLLFPETRASAEGLPIDGSWLVKTYNGASGSGVRVLSQKPGAGSGEQIEADKHCFQKRIGGTPCAAVYIAAEGEAQLLGVTRQIIGEPWLHSHGFQYAGSIGPWPVSAGAHATLGRLGNVLSDQFELSGLFGVDFMLDGEEVWTVEVNPRYTASVEIVERCTGVRAIAAHVAACGGSSGKLERAEASSSTVGAEDDPARYARYGSGYHGKATLFATRDVVISKEFADYSIGESLRSPWPTLGDASGPGTPIDNGRPVLTMFASGTSIAEVEHRLRESVVEVEHRLYIR
jgi:predicted ATP-grasp superfamily ATP-dependent carboligase